MAKRMALALAGTAAASLTRRAVRRAMHSRDGSVRVPERARRRKGLGVTLAWAAGTGALLGVADILSEQRQEAGRD